MAGLTRSKTASARASANPRPVAAAPYREREVMDIRQAAEYLGISSDSLYKYASEGFIPAFKLGNRWRFKRSLLESWMERQSIAGHSPKVTSVRASQKRPVARAR